MTQFGTRQPPPPPGPPAQPSNDELARIFHEIGNLLEIKGELVFKTVAYHKAADAIGHAPFDVAAVYAGGERRPSAGVGAAIGDKITELAPTGSRAFHDRLRAELPATLLDLLAKRKQPVPADRGGLVRCVLESLALEYSRRLNSVAELAGPRSSLYMVGGGVKNTLLCQLTADACGIPVYAGADQCTALGNALGQALALGVLKSRHEICQVMRDSFSMTMYAPRDQALWAEKRKKYAEVVLSSEI